MEIRDSLLKEHNNLISTGTIEEVPIEKWNTIPKSKQITSHTFTEVKPDNTLKSRTVAHGNKQTLETILIFFESHAHFECEHDFYEKIYFICSQSSSVSKGTQFTKLNERLRL